MISANERRRNIIETISAERWVTISALASRFNVSTRTISRDIEILSCEFPIETIQGNGGGVRTVDGWRYSKQYLNSSQEELLRRMKSGLQTEDQEILESILDSFAIPKLEKEKRHER